MTHTFHQLTLRVARSPRVLTQCSDVREVEALREQVRRLEGLPAKYVRITPHAHPRKRKRKRERDRVCFHAQQSATVRPRPEHTSSASAERLRAQACRGESSAHYVLLIHAPLTPCAQVEWKVEMLREAARTTLIKCELCQATWQHHAFLSAGRYISACRSPITEQDFVDENTMSCASVLEHRPCLSRLFLCLHLYLFLLSIFSDIHAHTK
jgi:hypothetical protein